MHLSLQIFFWVYLIKSYGIYRIILGSSNVGNIAHRSDFDYKYAITKSGVSWWFTSKDAISI